MENSRRSFLQGAAFGVASAAMFSGGADAASAENKAGNTSARALPKGMTFCTLHGDSGWTLGVRHERGILDVLKAEARFRTGAPTTISSLVGGEGDSSALLRLLDESLRDGRSSEYFVSEQSAVFGPCVTDPEKILCVGLNYRKHAAETNNPIPTVPVLFNKFNSALNGHRGTIDVSKEPAEKFDYEAELVIVIGRTARNVSEADALSYVFGYATGNDFTARDLQMRTSQWMLGKTGDGWAPIGPWLVTADQVDPNALKIEMRVNGQIRQSSNTSDLIFNCQQIVSYISKHVTLKPGDVIFTGTPEGVIVGYPKEKQIWLKPGDHLITSIEKLGDLEFKLA